MTDKRTKGAHSQQWWVGIIWQGKNCTQSNAEFSARLKDVLAKHWPAACLHCSQNLTRQKSPMFRLLLRRQVILHSCRNISLSQRLQHDQVQDKILSETSLLTTSKSRWVLIGSYQHPTSEPGKPKRLCSCVSPSLVLPPVNPSRCPLSLGGRWAKVSVFHRPTVEM